MSRISTEDSEAASRPPEPSARLNAPPRSDPEGRVRLSDKSSHAASLLRDTASRPSREAEQKRRSPIDEILASREPSEDRSAASRYGEGETRRRQKEREEIRESYLAMDIRLRSGEYRGLFYIDLSGSPCLSADHTMLTVPFRNEKLIIQGYRLLEVYRAILHYSLDILEETHRPEFAGYEEPVIETIEIVARESGH